MSSNGRMTAAPVGRGPAGGARLAQLAGGLTHGLWKDAPALTWLMNPDDGRLQFHCPHPAADPGPTATVHHEVLASRLLRIVQEEGPKPVRLLEVLPMADGRLRHFLIIGFPLSGIEGLRQPYLAGVAIDITHQQRRVEELAHQALVDELTGLYNLRGFFLFAEHELKVARRRGTRSAVVYVDVDGLKRINDTHGHERGSDILVEAADLLRHVFRECDVIARLGGDEFAVFAADVQGDPALLTRRLNEAVARGAADGTSGLALSAGVSSCPPGPGLRLAELLTAADQAMYQQKFEKLERRVER